MGKRDIHQKPFDDGTCQKLNLFRSYLREWLPVFIQNRGIQALQIFDLFAGPGKDINNVPGSPLIICDEILKSIETLKLSIYPQIKIFLNEYNKNKFALLETNLRPHNKCIPNIQFSITQSDFQDIVFNYIDEMNGNVANLVFLDQSGIKHISEDIFKSLIKLPRTDFIFFVSSSIVNRFRNLTEIRKYVPITDSDLIIIKGSNVHRILANAYRRWIPENMTYYLGSFSIKKGANVYGLIFGSGHPAGIDKFLHVAWKQGGDANFDIDDDRIDTSCPNLFPEMNIPTRVQQFENDLKIGLSDRQFRTNIDIFNFRLQTGFLDSHVRAGLAKIISDGIIPEQKLSTTYDAWKNHKIVSIVYPKKGGHENNI